MNIPWPANSSLPRGVSCCSIELTTPLYLTGDKKVWNCAYIVHTIVTCAFMAYTTANLLSSSSIFYLSPYFLLYSLGLSRSHIPTLTTLPLPKKFSYRRVRRVWQRMIHYSNTCSISVAL